MDFTLNTPEQQADMLDACGVSSIAALFADIGPHLRPKSFNLPDGKSEQEIMDLFQKLAAQNKVDLTCFLGGGFYDHYIPAAVDALAGRSEFYTAYTPYQAELSQGILQSIYEYQSDICRLTGMEVSNASMYEGGTALYEACMMAYNATGERRRLVIDGCVNPIYRQMLHCYGRNFNLEIVEVPHNHCRTNRPALLGAINDKTAAVVVQNPNFFGVIDDHSDIAAAAKQAGALSIQSVYPVALAVIKTPGEQGFDIACGEGQSLGLPLGFGGPYLGFLATRKEHARRMPGRIVGHTLDRNGKDAYILTLQAREQHIRREKATSNICSNEALCALRAHIFMSLMGKQGMQDLATLCMDKTQYARERLGQNHKLEVLDAGPAFNEIVVRLRGTDAAEIVGKLIDKGLLAGFPLGRYYPDLNDCLLIAVTEKRTKHDIGMLAEYLEAAL